MFYIPVVYSPIIYPSYYLQAHLKCHNRFYGKYYEIPRACVISVYQALPPVFQAPGKEASSTTTETSTSLITRPQTLMRKTVRWARSLLKQIITVTVNHFDI